VDDLPTSEEAFGAPKIALKETITLVIGPSSSRWTTFAQFVRSSADALGDVASESLHVGLSAFQALRARHSSVGT
jgi:hypothetical protein